MNPPQAAAADPEEAPDAPRAAMGRSGAALRPRDAYLVPALIAVVIAAQVYATGGRASLTRPLWLDEIHTALLVEDPSLGHAARALAAGADYNPPALYLITKAVAWAAGSSSEAALRSVGLLAIVAGLVGIYLTIRRAYPLLVALAATSAAWSHPMLAAHAFEARFYAPWFAAIVWFAYALGLADRRRGAWPRVLVAATAVLVCTLHYFGVFSLALVALAHTLAARRGVRGALAGLVPVAAGPAAVLACLPLYRGQKAALHAATWVAPSTIKDIYGFLIFIYNYYIFLIPTLALFVALAVRRPRVDRRDAVAEGDGPEAAGLAGLAGLAFMPVVVAAFSLLVQPALVNRYVIAVVASFGPLVAPVIARAGRFLGACVLAAFLAMSTINLRTESARGREEAAALATHARALAALEPVPVLFRKRVDLYPSWRYAPARRTLWALWDPTDKPGPISNFDQVERDVTGVLAAWYGLPPVAGIRSLHGRPAFYLFGFTSADVDALRAAFPDLRFRLVDESLGLYEVTLAPGRPFENGPR